MYDAIQLIDQKSLRGLPVVDDSNQCLGLLSAFKITSHLFPARDEASSARIITASLADIVTTFGGALVTGSLNSEPIEQLLMVCAMAQESFIPRLQHYSDKKVILIVGDRPHIQELAIQEHVHAVVVTGNLPISEEIRNAARRAKVTLISSPHDTATTVLLARGAVRVDRMIQTEYASFHRDRPLEEAKLKAAHADFAREREELLERQRELEARLAAAAALGAGTGEAAAAVKALEQKYKEQFDALQAQLAAAAAEPARAGEITELN